MKKAEDSTVVICCPKCHKSQNVIVERPSHSSPPYDVEFLCYCTKCIGTFDVRAKIYDIQYSKFEHTDEGYPYSA